jgi:putative membrane protein
MEQPGSARAAMVQLYTIDQLETDLALTGINQATNEDVREFASDLAEGHQEGARELMRMAREQKMGIAAAKDTMQAMQDMKQQTQSVRQKIQQASAAQFDQTFLDGVVQTHEMAIRDLRTRVQSVQDEPVKELLQNRLEALQKHVAEARDLQKQLQGGKDQGPMERTIERMEEPMRGE